MSGAWVCGTVAVGEIDKRRLLRGEAADHGVNMPNHGTQLLALAGRRGMSNLRVFGFWPAQ